MDQCAAIWPDVALDEVHRVDKAEGLNSSDGFRNRALIASGQLAGQNYRRTVFDRELLQSANGRLERADYLPGVAEPKIFREMIEDNKLDRSLVSNRVA